MGDYKVLEALVVRIGSWGNYIILEMLMCKDYKRILSVIFRHVYYRVLEFSLWCLWTPTPWSHRTQQNRIQSRQHGGFNKYCFRTGAGWGCFIYKVWLWLWWRTSRSNSDTYSGPYIIGLTAKSECAGHSESLLIGVGGWWLHSGGLVVWAVGVRIYSRGIKKFRFEPSVLWSSWIRIWGRLVMEEFRA